MARAGAQERSSMRTAVALGVTALLGIGVVSAAQGPEATITGGGIRAVLHMPDARAGYYRGTRFDWAGSIASLTWNGHSYFGTWFDRYEPTRHDAITGPVEEFASVGYDEAKVGDPFVRIGVGAVRKPDEAGYGQFKTYEIVDPGTRSIDRGADWIAFTHTLGDTGGYAYACRKTVRLSDRTLVLEHHLKNEGRKTIATTVYEHNFFMLDNQPTGPDTVIHLPFDVTATGTLNGLIETRGRDLVYLKALQAGESLYTELTGYGAQTGDYDIRVENRRTEAGVRQTSDRPLARLVLWSPRTTVCPEAYIDVTAAPGQETSWRISYEFYEVDAAGRK
jgi:hypothetical protein